MQVKDIPLDRLLDEVTRIHYEDFRLMQICATKVAENRYEILQIEMMNYDFKGKLFRTGVQFPFA